MSTIKRLDGVSVSITERKDGTAIQKCSNVFLRDK